MSSRPRIGVVGSGALGSYYGACLTKAGHDVHLLLRSDYEAVRERGIRIIDPDSEFTVRPGIARDPQEMGVCDVVLIGLKTTANSEFERLLRPLVGPGTALLTLQNGLGNEETLAGLFGPERILGGLCFVCLNRIEPGVIQHKAHGKIVMGEFQRPVSDRARQISSWFNAAGVHCEATDNLERAHWAKLVWNVPFNGLGVAAVAGLDAVLTGRLSPGRPLQPCRSTDALLGEARWATLVRGLMLEIIAAANAQGLGIPESLADDQITRTLAMGAYKASTLIDFERGLPLEVESLFGEPFRLAQEAGVGTPRLAALYSVLKELDKQTSAKPKRTG